MTTTLILVRHGRVEGYKRLIGHTDPPLDNEGISTLRNTAVKLDNTEIHALYSSDLVRSVTSAEIIGDGRGLKPVALPALRELYMGLWDGITVSEVMEKHPGAISKWWEDPSVFRTPEGESLGDLRARVVPEMNSILERHKGETVCVVAHGGVNRVVLFEAMGLPLSRYYSISQDYGCINRLRYFGDGKVVVDLMNG